MSIYKYNYHIYRAGLNARGGEPTVEEPAVGIDDVLISKVRAAGIPIDHTGQYIYEAFTYNMIDAIRTMNEHFNLHQSAYYPSFNLGKIILDFKNDLTLSVSSLGSFFYNFVNAVQSPCQGIALNFEYTVTDKFTYPITMQDTELGYYYFQMNTNNETNLINFRCRQFAMIFRIMFHVLKKFKFPNCTDAIVYSGYDGALYDNESIKKHYGCDFLSLTMPLYWRSISLPKITHAHCSWHTSIELPKSALDKISNFPVPLLHNIDLAPSLETRENVRAQIANRKSILRSQDGLASVEHGPPFYCWNPICSMYCEEIGEQV